MVMVKICGLTESDRVEQACDAGADMVGFVFFPPSRRALTPERAAILSRSIKGDVQAVGLFVNPDDHLIETTLLSVPLDVIQLHGEEKPARVAEIGLRFGVRTMKALPVAIREDLDDLDAYVDAADMILFDAKPVPGAALPGGNGVVFDWRLLSDLTIDRPWLLAGGLTGDNLQDALSATVAPGVDVSSGVETSPGIKDRVRMVDFIARAKAFKRNNG